jgi:hypothetical protein
MRQVISFVLALLIATQMVPAAFGAESVASQITALPIGTSGLSQSFSNLLQLALSNRLCDAITECLN